jgi:hypothetical protein
MEQAIINHFHFTLGTLKNGKAPPIFPGPQPISIERKHFQTLKNKDYVVCEKTDGVRHALVCTLFKGKKVCALLNRNLEVTPVQLNFPNSASKGTVLDGELIEGNRFLVYDGMSVCGENIMGLDFLKRIEKVGMFIKGIMKTKKDRIKIKLKHFFVKDDTQELVKKYIPSLKYKTDGLIFTPIFETVKLGTHESMFKWKPRDMNTIDFQLKWRGDRWGLYIQDRGVLIFQSQIQHIPGDEWLKEDNIVECQYMVDDQIPWWKPVGLRTDKNYPNNRRTFYRTLVNIKENIQEQEFY